MKTIYKYQVIGPGERVRMPADAQIVTGGEQDGMLFVWSLHGIPDDATTYRDRYFEVYGTGHRIPEDATYISTFFSGPFVWHVFELVAP